MSVIASIPPALDPADLVQLLDEHHLALIGGRARDRVFLLSELASRLECLSGSRIVRISSGSSPTCDRIVRQLERGFGLPLRTAPRGPEELRAALAGRTAREQRSFLFWADADALLEHDVDGFGAIAGAIMAASADREFMSEDRLTIERAIFAGGAKLGAYAEEDGGQFRSWHRAARTAPVVDGPGRRGRFPVRTSPENHALPQRPRVLIFRLDG